MKNIPHLSLLKNRGKETLPPTFMDLEHLKTPNQGGLANESSIMSSQVQQQEGGIPKKSDRLPNFTVNYL